MGAMRYLQEKQIKIPEELAVIGFDDYDWTQITSPPLCVIRQPSYELGEMAAKVLLGRIAEANRKVREYCLETTLVMRGSC
jgi:LacI family transcriptional regulator